MASKSVENFQRTKRLLLRNKELFEDPDFPANNDSIGKNPPLQNVVWKRPRDIVLGQRKYLEPLFIRAGATRADFDQGYLSNCWFIAASACLAVSNKDILNDVIQPDGQAQTFSAGDYAGIFRFRFWRYGKWEEVIIDDRLPTIDGKLIFAQNYEEANEFWAALMEKAYAKLHGSYYSLEYGFSEDAMVDLTGGIATRYQLDATAPKSLFEIMQKALRSHCMMGSSISAERRERTPSQLNGIAKGHSYSITAVTEIQTTDRRRHKLVRLRNPWACNEWHGDWSDRSKLWLRVDQKSLERINFKQLEDGEFWMSYDDWFQNFEELEMCYLSADDRMNPLALDSDKTKWKRTRHVGKWKPGVSAGGRPSGNPPHNEDYYWRNPQYRVELAQPRIPPDDEQCTMLVSLMKVDSRKNEDIRIGVSVYKESRRFGELREKVVDSGYFYNREVTAHFTGESGQYIVVPSTFEPNQEASFLLRIFTE